MIWLYAQNEKQVPIWKTFLHLPFSCYFSTSASLLLSHPKKKYTLSSNLPPVLAVGAAFCFSPQPRFEKCIFTFPRTPSSCACKPDFLPWKCRSLMWLPTSSSSSHFNSLTSLTRVWWQDTAYHPLPAVFAISGFQANICFIVLFIEGFSGPFFFLSFAEFFSSASSLMLVIPRILPLAFVLSLGLPHLPYTH